MSSEEKDLESCYFARCSKIYDQNSPHVEKINAIRDNMVALYTTGLNSLSNESTCLLLRENLFEYSRNLHDDSNDSKVKSVSKSIETIIKGKVRPDICTNRKSNLKSSGIDGFSILKENLKRINHCNIENDAPCNTNEVTDEELRLLFKKKTISDEPMKPTMIAQKRKLSDPSQDMIVKPKTAIINDKNICSDKQNHSDLYKAPKFSFMQPKIPMNNSMHRKNYHDNSVFSDQGVKNNSHKNAKMNHTQRNDLSDERKQSLPVFKTARDELVIQNKKKYASSSNYNQETVQKRSLGTARSIQNKFIPPITNSTDDNTNNGDDEVQDERLKNIDPKMIELIKNEIIDLSTSVSWDDIAGLNFAKNAIQEAVVWPLLRPDIFTGLRRPPRGILLFGPPGTGKTLIGKCIASQCSATFFSISASSLTSKWLGDGEKMVRALFAVARCHQPAVVFIDEIDSLLTQRSDTEHEATRRIKTEFLVQLDGAATGDDDRLLLIGATNRPQELDEAARRRLVKRLYIPLPDITARKQIVNRLMSNERHSLMESDIDDISRLADGFSGADMKCLCAEAALGPIRAVPLSQMSNIECEQVRPVGMGDFQNALLRVRPSVSQNDLEQYTKWDKTYGSGNDISN